MAEEMLNGIHPLQPNNFEEHLRLSEFAFQYEMTDEERTERQKHIKPEQSWVYYEEGNLAARLSILPLSVWINGNPMEMGGIAAVATWPEYRRGGKVAKLLGHSLQVMRGNGQTISMLYPFDFAFYRKFGWEIYVDYKTYELTKDQIPRFEPVFGKVKRTEDRALLNGMYEEYAQRYNGMLRRDEAWWKDRLSNAKKGVAAVWYNDAGVPKGYIRYNVKNQEMKIHEMVFLDDEAYRGLWAFIAQHDSMADKVVMKAPMDDSLSFIAANPRFKQEIVPYFMARIVDASAFIEGYHFTAGVSGRTLILHLEDTQADWNRGSFRIEVDEKGRASVNRLEASPASSHQQSHKGLSVEGVSCDIQALTALLMGYKRTHVLNAVGRIQGDEAQIALLESLIPVRTPYLLDFF